MRFAHYWIPAFAGMTAWGVEIEESYMKMFWAFALLGTLALPACVTINIYFPAAAAEKAADKIIDEVWQIKKGDETKDKESAQ
jgi:hypothetical protein